VNVSLSFSDGGVKSTPCVFISQLSDGILSKLWHGVHSLCCGVCGVSPIAARYFSEGGQTRVVGQPVD